MRHTSKDSHELPGQDSFLDIVANIVGILILLVMVVGLRAARSDQDRSGSLAKPSDSQQAVGISEEVLERAIGQARLTHGEVSSKIMKTLATQEQVAFRDAARIELATYVAVLEEELAEKRKHMSLDEQRSYDLQRKLGAAQQKYEELSREQVAVVAQQVEEQIIESLPTPLAKSVRSDYVTVVYLHNQHAKIVPYHNLIEQAYADAQDSYRRKHASTITVTSSDGGKEQLVSGFVGPQDGFRFEYKARVVPYMDRRSGRGGNRILMTNGELKPISPTLGEPVTQETFPDSQLLLRILTESESKSKPVMIITYEGSSNEGRIMKQELHKHGFGVSIWPMQRGKVFGVSPNGRRAMQQ